MAAGPFEGGGGIFIFSTTSVEEAKQWLSTDPGVQANRWIIEVLPFTMRQGAICKLEAPYEMVSYHFIRFRAVVTKTTAQDFPDLIRRHDDYLKTIAATGNVLIEGTFGDNEGGMMVMRGDLDAAVFEHDPAVQEELVQAEKKVLYIAKGAFCEK